MAYNVSLPCSAADVILDGTLSVPVMRAHLSGHSCSVRRRRRLEGGDGGDGGDDVTTTDDSGGDAAVMVDADATAMDEAMEGWPRSVGSGGASGRRQRRRSLDEPSADSDWDDGDAEGDWAATVKEGDESDGAPAQQPTADFSWDCVMRGRQRCRTSAAAAPPPSPPRSRSRPGADDGDGAAAEAGAAAAVTAAAGSAEGCGVGDVTRLVSRLTGGGGIVRNVREMLADEAERAWLLQLAGTQLRKADPSRLGASWSAVTSSAMRTAVPFGLPLAGYNTTTGGALSEQLQTRLDFIRDVLTPAIDEATRGAQCPRAPPLPLTPSRPLFTFLFPGRIPRLPLPLHLPPSSSPE